MQNLMNNENLVYKTNLSLAVFFNPIFAFIITFILLVGGPTNVVIISALTIVLLWFLAVLVRYFTNSFIITNKRVLMKYGLITTNTEETLLNKIEGIEIKQGLIDKLFGTGTIIIKGTGGSSRPFSKIKNPIEFRKQVSEMITSN